METKTITIKSVEKNKRNKEGQYRMAQDKHKGYGRKVVFILLAAERGRIKRRRSAQDSGNPEQDCEYF